ncbi:MAG: LysM peptidoglycan-binding domain-containing protein [Lewinellaceae bacterium]|nr:LysM peptidoglycan-binding domain-containing protein [Lewinellaceae bacterium]
MKQTTIFTLLSLCLAGALSAQPLYILFDATCMNQLEYRYVYTGAISNSYSMQPSAGEHFQLQAGSQGINSPTLPPNTVKCREYNFNEQFLNEVNNLSRQVYVVHQQSKGYLLVPIISAGQIIRSGPYYMVRARNYAFAVDTSNLVYESNIATGSSEWYIYFNGLKIRGCFYEYSFKREPTRANQERSEFDFIPGVGLSTERTGMTAADAENNQYRLVKVNNIALEDYIVARCQGKPAPSTTPVSQYTPQVEYGVVREGDKETASMGKQPAGTIAGPPALANCPEQPGEGYHIVQPGHTLNAISRAYKVPVKSLVAWNKMKDPDQISVCQKIWIRKPPADAPVVAYQGQQKPAAYSTQLEPDANIRQDVYWQNPQLTGKTIEPTAYSLMQPQPQPQPQLQPQPTYTPPQGQTLVHTVQKGETLYGIGQRYGVTESDMRRLNKFPATGAVNVQPGMQVFVADCCPSQSQQPTTNPTTTQPIQPQPQTQPAVANPGPGVLPAMFSTSGTTSPTPTTTTTPNTTTPTTTPPTYFQEYIVREGDTINSIAIRFKVNAAELALVNNKDPNEALIAGQRLLIPRT